MNAEEGTALGTRLRERDVTAGPAALNLLESTAPGDADAITALQTEISPTALGREAPGHIVGVTGPPGAGKSTLLSELVAEWRRQGCSVAVLAVDPSSKRSGGALLGDRARIQFDPADREVFIRSTAAGTRLGGLAPATRIAAHALAAAFDIVVVETVGVGQSETEIAEVADTVAVVVQPGSGDVLQFLKSGIMEIPDVLVVTKADLGQIAQRSIRDIRAALRSVGAGETEAITVSAVHPTQGIDELAASLQRHRERTDLVQRRLRARRLSALASFEAEYGTNGLRAVGGVRGAKDLLEQQAPTLDVSSLSTVLRDARK